MQDFFVKFLILSWIQNWVNKKWSGYFFIQKSYLLTYLLILSKLISNDSKQVIGIFKYNHSKIFKFELTMCKFFEDKTIISLTIANVLELLILSQKGPWHKGLSNKKATLRILFQFEDSNSKYMFFFFQSQSFFS